MNVNNTLRSFKDATVIITGGASGIGKEFAKELARQKAEVVIADLQLEAAEALATEINSEGGKASSAMLDVCDATAVEELIRSTYKRTGRLDYMFNNAGISHNMGSGFQSYELSDWTKIINVNLFGVIYGVQVAYEIMLKQGFGHIVNTASIAGLVCSPGMGSYVTTKHAVVGLSTTLRAEAAQFGINVSVLCPGAIRTPFIEGGKYSRNSQKMLKDDFLEMWEQHRPMAADQFAREALVQIKKNKGIIVLPKIWKLFWWLYRLSTSLSITLGTKYFKPIDSEVQKR